MNERKLLSAAVLTEEDEFYAECNVAGINLVDRVNGKPVRVYPYWIDRPNCNWHSPPEEEEGEEVDENEGEDEDESEDESDGKNGGNRQSLIGRLTQWWKRRDVINVKFSEKS